jgi:hypothetical protein
MTLTGVLVDRVCVQAVLIALGFGSQAAPPPRTAVISGVVVNDRKEPVARVQVQAFSVRAVLPGAQQYRTIPFSNRASGSATTEADGRFQISGLESGEYFVAAEPVPLLTSGFATTFYPSTIDHLLAAQVSATRDGGGSIRIELARVKGARLSGSVTSSSGRPTIGMSVGLFRRFGNFGSGDSRVAVVTANGTFEIPRVPPGWYRLTIESQQSGAREGGGEFASMVIHVQDRDIEDVSLVLTTGATISGRVAAEPGSEIPSPVGLRVNASPAPEEYAPSWQTTYATVTFNWSFTMTGLSGVYEFTAAADRPPFVKATRVVVDGKDAPAGRVELTDGPHEVVVFVAQRESPAPSIDKGLSTVALVEQFKNEQVFFRQFDIAKEIVNRQDARVLPALESWLTHVDRHQRSNAAFIFGKFGDPRGLQVISEILDDRSYRPEGQGIPTASSDGRYHFERQIRSDRYYAAHLLGDLGDPRAVPILVALLKDTEVISIVPWALGQIGDRGAIGPLIAALDDDDPSKRVSLIYALETLDAKEALPRLTALLNDERKSNFGAQVSVADAARGAIAKLKK